MHSPRIGIQLYTLRNECAADLLGTLRRVAELGYEGVEFAGYFGVPAAEIYQTLQELGLTAIGSHVGLPALRERLQEEIRFLKDISSTYMVCPGIPGEEHDTASWRRNLPLLRQAANQAAQAGLQFAYHNHAYEFQLELDGAPVFDSLFPYSSIDKTFLSELDTCWAAYAKHDPIEVIRRLAGNVPLLHLKDYRITEQDELITLPLGEGEAPLERIIEAAGTSGVQWLIVEQDHAGDLAPLTCVERSMQWLITNYYRA